MVWLWIIAYFILGVGTVLIVMKFSRDDEKELPLVLGVVLFWPVLFIASVMFFLYTTMTSVIEWLERHY